MKKFLLNISAIVVLVYGTFWALSCFDNSDYELSNHSNIVRLRDAKKHDSLDILFVGNSYCYSSINTRMLCDSNILSYNLGVSTAGPSMYSYIIKDYLNHCKKNPAKIICAYSLVTFTEGSDNWSKYPIHRYLNSPISNAKIALENLNLKLYFSLLYNSGKKGFKNIFLNPTNEKRKPLEKGFWNDSTCVTNKLIEEKKHLYEPYKNNTFDEQKFNALIDLYEFCKEVGVSLEFVEIPSFKFKEYVSNSFKKKYESSKSILNSKGINIYSFEFPEEFKLYRNIDHMNLIGANFFTIELLKSIKQNKDFKGNHDLLNDKK